MKFKEMKQVVAGLALSAVMLGATAFEAHPAMAAVREGSLEQGRGIYREVSDMTAQQKTDLQWFRQERTQLLKKQWQYEVDNGYMSQKEMDARMTIMQEANKRVLKNDKVKKPSYEEKEAAKKFAKKYRKADKAQKQQLLKEKLDKDLAAGRINQKEYDARMIIAQERSKAAEPKQQPTVDYKNQKAKFAKQAKELNREYIKKCLVNGRLTAEQGQKLLNELDKIQATRAGNYIHDKAISQE